MADARGLSESVQWALLAPLVVLAVLGLVQSGIWLHARDAATSAALAGAETQALSGSGSGMGPVAARRVAEQGGLREVEVVVVRVGDQIRCTVSGRVDGISMLGRTRVDASAMHPLEEP